MRIVRRKEGGWELWFRDGVKVKLRYIIPEGNIYVVINPYLVQQEYLEFSTFLAACRYVKKSVAM